jgi:hypothetical protein
MKKQLKIVTLLVFVSVLAFMGYKIVSKINHKKEFVANIKTILNFKYRNLKAESFSNKNLKTDIPALFIYVNSQCAHVLK